MNREIHEMTLYEAKQELQKLRPELCIKYYNTGDSESKKLVKAISLVLDNCH